MTTDEDGNVVLNNLLESQVQANIKALINADKNENADMEEERQSIFVWKTKN